MGARIALIKCMSSAGVTEKWNRTTQMVEQGLGHTAELSISISTGKRRVGREGGTGAEYSTGGSPKPDTIHQIGGWICAYLSRSESKMVVSWDNFNIRVPSS